MKILLVAATFDEILPLVDHKQKKNEKILKSTILNVDILITGIGIAATIFNLTKCLTKNKYNFVINAGICGAYSSALELGCVVEVARDSFADRIVENKEKIVSWQEAGLNTFDNTIEQTHWLKPGYKTKHLSFRQVNAITSDTVHSNNISIRRLKSIFNPDIETMEGACVFYVCSFLGIKSLQLRAVSNIVGIRDKKKWKTAIAIHNLSAAVKETVNEIKTNSELPANTYNSSSCKDYILNKISYTGSAYGRINKKLTTAYSDKQIEREIFELISESNPENIIQIGKNIYIHNTKKCVRITVNSNTYRVITVDRIENNKKQNII